MEEEYLYIRVGLNLYISSLLPELIAHSTCIGAFVTIFLSSAVSGLTSGLLNSIVSTPFPLEPLTNYKRREGEREEEGEDTNI